MTREEARAEAEALVSKHPREHQSEHEVDSWKKQYAERLLFEANYDEWLKSRIIEHKMSNEEIDLRSRREDELALSLLVTPAPLNWMVFKKFEVLEYYLGKFADDYPDETDRLAVIATAGIKSDLMRFGIGKGE